jgi:two-component system phosphate regulon response regulator PhoB
MTDTKLKILCIEDDADTCDLLTFVFNDAGYEVTSCSQTDCLKLIHEENFSAIILDNYFDGMSGIDICKEIRSIDQTVPIIFLSGEARQSEIDKAMAIGANEYLIKPNDFEKLVPTTMKLIEQSQAPA